MEAQTWIKGLERHREMEVKIGLKDLSPNQLFKMLKADKAQATFTGDICSPTYGLCGSPDCVEITREDSRLRMGIVEWKADWKGSYWLQL